MSFWSDVQKAVEEGTGNARHAGEKLFETDWYGDTRVPDTCMSEGPSAVAYHDKLYVFYQGASHNGRLWFKMMDSNGHWSYDHRVPDTCMSGSPSAMVYDEKIWVWHQGGSDNKRLWHNILDPRTGSWSGDKRSEPVEMTWSPSAVVMKDGIYVFYQKATYSGELWCFSPNIKHPGAHVKIYNSVGLSSSPSATLNEVDGICVVHQGHRNDGTLWLGNYDYTGYGLIQEDKAGNTGLSESPSAVKYKDMIWCFHQSEGHRGNLWYNVYEFQWNKDSDTQVPDTRMTSSPSAVVWKGKLYVFHQGGSHNGQLWYNQYRH